MAKNFSNVEYPANPPPHTKDQSLSVLDLFSLKGKTASITGSSSGIGYAVAEAYAQAGANVAIWYNRKDASDKAEALAKKYGTKVKAYKADVSNEEDVKKAFSQQIKDFGQIDIVVANAGVPWTKGAFIDQPDNDHFHDVVDIDFKGVAYIAKVAGLHFRETHEKDKNHFGSLILTSSMSGHIVNVPQLQATYNAAKAAVRHFGRSLAVEWAGFARVNSVSPGYINTEISDFIPKETQNKWWSMVPMGRGGEVAELVGIYLFLASPASSYTTGSDFIVDGGYAAP